MTPCSARILTSATEHLDVNVFTLNPSTSKKTSAWHRVQAKLFHLQYNTGSGRVVRLWDELLKPRVFIFNMTKTLFSPPEFSDRFWHPHNHLLNWAGGSSRGSKAALL